MGITIREFHAADDPAAVALEAACPQGKAIRLRFMRHRFAERSERYDDVRLMVAHNGERMVGICGGALKPVLHAGQPATALFLFDMRVHPSHQRQGIARDLAEALIEWAKPYASMAYAYAVGDNVAIQGLAQQWIGADAHPACRILTLDSGMIARQGAGSAEHSDPVRTQGLYLHTARAKSMLTDMTGLWRDKGLRGSWMRRLDCSEAATSAFSNEGVLGETVVRLPLHLTIASYLTRMTGGLDGRLPHIPAKGEALRSWYLFDFSATSEAAAIDLVRAVASTACADDIRHLHIIAPPDAPWIGWLRRLQPAWSAPVTPYSIMARDLPGGPRRFERLYVDVRDL